MTTALAGASVWPSGSAPSAIIPTRKGRPSGTGVPRVLRTCREQVGRSGRMKIVIYGTDHYLVVGQRPCHYLSFLVQSAGAARPPHPLHREGCGVVSQPPRLTTTGILQPAALRDLEQQPAVGRQGCGRDRGGILLSRCDRRHARAARCGYGPLLFYDIDTPVTLAALCSRGKTEYLEADLIPHYAAYLSLSGGPALRVIEERFQFSQRRPFYCSVDPSLYKPTPPEQAYRCDLSYLGTYAADRQPKLMQFVNGAARLLPDSAFVVAGPQYPADTAWQQNVRRFDHVAPPDHPPSTALPVLP